MPEVFLDKFNDIAHEITGHSDRVPMRITVRCQADFPPQLGPTNIGSGPVTCLMCIGEPVEDVPYRCNVPMCGESGVCEECRKRGAR